MVLRIRRLDEGGPVPVINAFDLDGREAFPNMDEGTCTSRLATGCGTQWLGRRHPSNEAMWNSVRDKKVGWKPNLRPAYKPSLIPWTALTVVLAAGCIAGTVASLGATASVCIWAGAAMAAASSSKSVVDWKQGRLCGAGLARDLVINAVGMVTPAAAFGAVAPAASGAISLVGLPISKLPYC